MTKRHCYVQDVGIAIEKLADALDPQRTKPFSGDILDLLEWAAKDVLAMRSENEKAQAERDTFYMDYRIKCDEQTKSLHVEVESLSQQLAEYKGSYENACNLVARMHAAAVGEVTGPRRGVVEDVEDLRQQLAERDEQISDLTVSSDTYFAERNSARDVWRRASKDRDELRQQLTKREKQVTLLRDALYKYSNGASGALAATEPKP